MSLACLCQRKFTFHRLVFFLITLVLSSFYYSNVSFAILFAYLIFVQETAVPT